MFARIFPSATNKYLKRLAKRVLGDEKSPAGSKYSNLTMYDFRHCSCCYWLPKYKSESALKYRFGWKKSDKIHYYSEMLGIASLIGLIDGAFFFSNRVTGNAISNLSNVTSSWIGGMFFLIGLVGCFFWIKNKKKK
jgi:hypothetical protein